VPRSTKVRRGDSEIGYVSCSITSSGFEILPDQTNRDKGLVREAERPSPLSGKGLYPALLWWRGQDLNLRPSGYEAPQSRVGGCHLLPESASDLRVRVPPGAA